MQSAIQLDVAAVNRIDAIRIILKTLSRLTKMRISLVSRIVDGSWTACAVVDDAKFGLNVGDQLELESTY